jgi:LEA14-like dessication related protein
MRRTLALLPLLLLVACPKFDLKDIMNAADPYLPKLHFKKLDVKSVSWEKAKVDFVFNVDNPNPIKVHLASFAYDLGFEGTRVVEGSSARGLDLPANDAASVRIPVNLVYTDVYKLVKATKGKDDIGFRLQGHLGFDTPIGELKVPYDENGSFPAPRTPKFRFQKLRVQKLDVAHHSATIALDLGVTNEHASSLSFTAFSYDLGLAGKDVASGRVASLGSVAGGGEGTLTLPVTVDLLAAGTVVVEALTRKTPLDATLGAHMDVGTPFGVIPLSVDQRGSLRVE